MEDHRARIIIEERIDMLPMGPAVGMTRMLRHPDGTIYYNTQSEHGLARSCDKGRTWDLLPLHFPEAQPDQFPSGFGITREGRLFIVHQQAPGAGGHDFTHRELYVSFSVDCGTTWETTSIDFARLAPGAPRDPYATADTAHCFASFIELPDGALMFSTSLRYADWDQYLQEDQSRPGIRDVMIRSHDGGHTWGDATLVHQHATETDHAIDPHNPDRILSASRKQRPLLPGEEQEAVEKQAFLWGTKYSGTAWPWKGGILLESTDRGRTFREVPESYTGYYGHRAGICWASNNIVIFAHNDGYSHDREPPIPRCVARLSLDGGRTWVDGTRDGTPAMNRSTQFSEPGGPSTIEVAPDRFFTAYREFSYDRTQSAVRGVFWHLERP